MGYPEKQGNTDSLKTRSLLLTRGQWRFQDETATHTSLKGSCVIFVASPLSPPFF